MIEKLVWGVMVTIFLAGSTCGPRPVIQEDYGPRLEAIEERLTSLEEEVDSLKTEINRANANDEILNENMERLYGEVDELREKMGLERSGPRRKLIK